MTISDARNRLGDAVETARLQREPVFLTRHGKRVGVIEGIAQWTSRQTTEAPAADADIQARLDAIAARAAALVKPGIPPLLDPSAFYDTRNVAL